MSIPFWAIKTKQDIIKYLDDCMINLAYYVKVKTTIYKNIYKTCYGQFFVIYHFSFQTDKLKYI